MPQYAAPARATDLTGLPPAFLDVGSAECLRDEVLAYAGRTWQEGGKALQASPSQQQSPEQASRRTPFRPS